MGYLLCLTPRTANATRKFLIFKLVFAVFVLLCLTYEITFTYFSVKFFRDQIKPTSSRSHSQLMKTHSHFFTLSGIWSVVCILVAIWGLITEYLGLILGSVFMVIGGISFQFMGAISSTNMFVIQLKALGSIYEPLLILFSLAFAHLVHKNQDELNALPDYRRTLSESRKSSLNDLMSIAGGYVPSPKPFVRNLNFVAQNNNSLGIPNAYISPVLKSYDNQSTLPHPSHDNKGYDSDDSDDLREKYHQEKSVTSPSSTKEGKSEKHQKMKKTTFDDQKESS